MLTSQDIKTFALDTLKMDKVGIANIERFDGAPADMHPRSMMPGARSAIVMIRRIPRGLFRGIDEGTHWPAYTAFGYAGINLPMAKANYRLARYLEDRGYEAMHVSGSATLRERGPVGKSPGPGLPRREVTLHHRIAAVLAGLGEIGWSKVFLTEEFGPRQRIVILLTDAVLEPDPIRVGHICDNCQQCVRECPGQAIPADKSVTLDLCGHAMEWADIDLARCKLTHGGLNRTNAPHLIKRFPGLNLPLTEQSLAWKEVLDLIGAVAEAVPTYQALGGTGHTYAICGARGCMIGCMKHLERRGKTKNKFVEKPVFSDEKPWRLPATPEPPTHHGMIYDPETEPQPGRG